MRSKIIIEIDRKKTIYEKELEVLLDIREMLEKLIEKQENEKQ